MCYIGSWAEWHAKPYDFLIEKTNTEFCTHIAYGFAILDEYEYTIKVFDPALDLGKTAEITWAHGMLTPGIANLENSEGGIFQKGAKNLSQFLAYLSLNLTKLSLIKLN